MKKLMLIVLLAAALSLAGCSEGDNPNEIPDEVPTEVPDEVPADKPAPKALDPDVPEGQSVFIDSADLMVMESYPVQVGLLVVGNKSTPCHELQLSIETMPEDFEIRVSMSAVDDSELACNQVLAPIEENISLPVEGLPDGIYKVYLNSVEVGEFSYPG